MNKLLRIIKQRWKQLVVLSTLIFVMMIIVPSTWLFQKQDIHHISIRQITYTQDAIGSLAPQYETIVLELENEIDEFISIWASQLLILLPDDNVANSHGINENSKNYWIQVHYDDTIRNINVFGNYGSPIDIDGRTLWFSLFQSKNHIYQEIKTLFDQSVGSKY